MSRVTKTTQVIFRTTDGKEHTDEVYAEQWQIFLDLRANLQALSDRPEREVEYCAKLISEFPEETQNLLAEHGFGRSQEQLLEAEQTLDRLFTDACNPKDFAASDVRASCELIRSILNFKPFGLPAGV